MNTNDFFLPGKLSVLLDGSFGSSGKGKIEAFLVKHSDNVDFVCNNNMPQASHTTVDNGEARVYKQLNSCAHFHDKFNKMYIGQGSVIDLKALMSEIKDTQIPPAKLGIDPLAAILQPIDTAYEKGEAGFDGEKLSRNHSGTMKNGSTSSGVGAVVARKALRRPNALYARDIKELQPYLCDVSSEILKRLAAGKSGLLSLPQGFPLSNGLSQFHPHCTSRNISVVAGLNDMMLPVTVIGNVLLNFRTYPIRIHSFKYLCKETGRHLTWDEVQANQIPYNKIDSDSGPFYPDQQELTWEELTEMSGSETPLMECTTLTKLPRRVATFSQENLKHAIDINQTPHNIYISLNFMNYVSGDMTGVRDTIDNRAEEFIETNIHPVISKYKNVRLRFLGTGAETDDFVVLERQEA